MKYAIFSLLFLFLLTPLVSAAEKHEGSMAAVMQKDAIEYTLPYPGLLPDSPIYPLKASRDKFIAFLIADPLKKAEFSILQADKRLQSGIALLDKNKFALGQSTISKGQNYFEEALSQLGQARGQGLAINDSKQKLILSLNKHEEVLKNKEKTLKKDQKKEWQPLLDYIHKLQKKAKDLEAKK